MLDEWSITNFKSFRESNLLPLKPLTIICGANSSGKSTLIQSMLLIKQTLQHAPPSRAIALNGPLVRLGGFYDILNYQTRCSADNAAIGVGWRLQRPRRADAKHENMTFVDEELQNVSVLFNFEAASSGSDQATANLQPALRNVVVKSAYMDSEGGEHELLLDLKKSSGKGRKLSFNTSTFSDQTAYSTFKIDAIDLETKTRATAARPSATLAGCLTEHFFPATLVVRYDRAKATARQITTQLVGNVVGSRRLASSTLLLSERSKNIIRRALENDSILSSRGLHVDSLFASPSTTGDITISELSRRIGSYPPSFRNYIKAQIGKKQQELERSIYDELGKDLTLSPVRVETLRAACDLTDSFFRFSLRYIGPLRDEPRPLYPLQALTSPTDVGPKGELTAAVFHLNQAREITYIPSKQFTSESFSTETVKSSLKNAVTDWLAYLGVAAEVETSEQGKFGHALRIKTKSEDQYQDLTNVGFGVSQLLPIVITCLLSSPGSTVIIEQPELHLHPAVQARLADFFISMTSMGRQCIIETHGEHLVERLRFRVACDLTDTVLNNTKIYFFEHLKGATNFRDIKLNKYGAIEDWPDDFFDQSQKESEHIVIRALARRKAEKIINQKSS